MEGDGIDKALKTLRNDVIEMCAQVVETYKDDLTGGSMLLLYRVAKALRELKS